MKPSLREVLRASHVSAVAVVVLLVWSFEEAFRGLLGPLWRAADFLITAVAILDIPYFSRTLTVVDRLMLITAFSYLLGAIGNLAAAWLLSRWVYGLGPFRCLNRYYTGLARRKHA